MPSYSPNLHFVEVLETMLSASWRTVAQASAMLSLLIANVKTHC